VNRRRSSGFVLVVVIFFAVLLMSSIATFLRRATIDASIISNRDNAARAEALARGGVQLAIAVLLQDRIDEQAEELRAESGADVWARIGELPILTPDGGELQLRIVDTGARLNLNALFAEGEPLDDKTEILLSELLEKVIDEMPGRPEEKLYDPEELARSLIDFVDEDDLGVRGGREDDYYQGQSPPYRAPNRPLLSVAELRMVEGFDGPLVEGLRPYVTVYPYAGGGGINPNTAPTWVLASLYHGTEGHFRLAVEDDVSRLAELRASGAVLCPEDLDNPACSDIREIMPDTIYPPLSVQSDIFHVRSEARYANVRRRVEAVIDRSDVEAPAILAWQAR